MFVQKECGTRLSTEVGLLCSPMTLFWTSDALHRFLFSEILESCAYSCALKQNVCAKGAANTEDTGLGHGDTLQPAGTNPVSPSLRLLTTAPRVIVTSAGTGVKSHRKQNNKQQTRTARIKPNQTTATITKQKRKRKKSTAATCSSAIIGINFICPVLRGSLYYSCPISVKQFSLYWLKKSPIGTFFWEHSLLAILGIFPSFDIQALLLVGS